MYTKTMRAVDFFFFKTFRNSNGNSDSNKNNAKNNNSNTKNNKRSENNNKIKQK